MIKFDGAPETKAATAAGQVVVKEIDQNDTVRIYEATLKPGDVSPMRTRPLHAVYPINGGTLERTYEDGKKETIHWTSGEARIVSEPPLPYSVRNVGETVVHLFVVVPK
jgi:hypothetical protein